jgi:hypothetical protein
VRRIGVSGHQELPAQAVEFIITALADTVRAPSSDDEVRGLTSLAAGADQLFAEVVLAHQGRLDIVIPCAHYEDTFTEKSAASTFRSLLARASTVEQLKFPTPSEEAFYAAGRRIVDCCDELVAVWDGNPSRGLGGTADIVSYAVQCERPVTVIWPKGVVR